MFLWQLEMFGDLRLFHDSQDRTRLRTRKTEALLAYLALFPDTTHTRERLAGLLWETSRPQEARNSLSVALHALRSVLEIKGETSRPVLLADRVTVRLDAGLLVTDVARFEQALRDADAATDDERRLAYLQDALACYRGPLLSAFYDDWVIAERHRLEMQAHEGMRQAARLLAKRNELRPALEYARRAAALAPLHEANCRDVMRLHAALGNPHDALTTYRAFAHRLQESLQTVPSAATAALAEQLTRRAGAVTSASPASAPQSAALDRFFGRDAESATLETWLKEGKDNAGSAALITLTGMGGVGKTRLAKEVARRSASLFGTHIHFFSLADETNPARLFETLCSGLRLPRAAETPPLEQLAGVLGETPALFILDNFEQLVDCGDRQAQALRGRIPNLVLLVTSRQRLNVTGEREFALLPLPIPQSQSDEIPASLESFACVQLFVDRCRQYQADFALTPENAETIAQICARLEGLPLALELAAAWSRVLSPPQMLARLQKRFDLLVSARRDLPDRHRSLRATIEGSYRLLPPELRRFFARLAVFAGGWDLEAAQEICGDDALGMLAALQDTSLIVTQRDAEGTPRFRLLDTLREFAAEQQTNGERSETQARFIAYFTGLAEQGQGAIRGPETRFWLERLDTERDNFRAALALCFAPDAAFPLPQSAIEAGIRLTAALINFWFLRGYQSEWERWQKIAYAAAEAVAPEVRAALYMEIADGYPAEVDARFAEKALELSESLQNVPLMARAKLLLAFSPSASPQASHALRLTEEALTLLRDADRADLLGYALNQRAVIYCQLDKPKAQAAFDEAIATLRQANAPYILTKSLFDAAFYVMEPGSVGRAEVLLEEALALCAALDFHGGRAHGLWILGKVVRGRDINRAEACFQESLALHRRYGFINSKSLPLSELGYTALLKEEYAEARAFFREGYAVCTPAEKEGMHGVLMWCALGLREDEAFRFHCEEHLRLMSDADAALNETLGMRMFAAVRAGKFAAARPLYAELAALWKQNMSLLPLPIFFMAAARWMAEEGQFAIASRLLGAEANARQKHRAFYFPIEARIVAQTEALLRAALPEAEWAALYAEGKAMNADTRHAFVLTLPL